VSSPRGEVVLRVVPVAATRPLRRDVLRPAETVEGQAAHEPAGARAVAALLGDEVIAVGLVGPEGESGAWRVRGMATAPGHRGRGYGAAVLRALVEHAARAGATAIWCTARMPARSLYERAGFRIVGEPYDVHDIGPHIRMELRTPEPR
jgi:GNAT superfamily N-acetyltransferase